MESAAAEVMQGKKSLRKAGRDRSIDKTTLKRFITKTEKGEVKSVAWGAVAEVKRIFTGPQGPPTSGSLCGVGLCDPKARAVALPLASRAVSPIGGPRDPETRNAELTRSLRLCNRNLLLLGDEKKKKKKKKKKKTLAQ
ncbi:unnamed protein product [Pleuronectes platessa]|uniref:Uncharacterized protein n=1 Tax=Pleuronectes platessa TaxID=8262 RepID=A0A9N7UDZ7_PLEPL|nr:unnamed protein product [Pleuronectes platessa]